MTSSNAPRCDPRFPTSGVLLDASALLRFWKCNAIEAFADTVELHAAFHVEKEFKRQGPAARAAFDRLSIRVHRVGPSDAPWEAFCRIRGGRVGTRDLGEDQSIAVATVVAADGVVLPFVTYDRGATMRSSSEGVVTLDFLDTLAWLVGCGKLAEGRADEIESLASAVDGWKRPVGYCGAIEAVRAQRQRVVVERLNARNDGGSR